MSLAADSSVLAAALDPSSAQPVARELFSSKGGAVLVADVELATITGLSYAALSPLTGMRLVSATQLPSAENLKSGNFIRSYVLEILRQNGATRLLTLRPSDYAGCRYGDIAIEPLVVPETAIPYGRHSVSEEDVVAVAAVLRSSWLTGGPQVEAFESDFAAYTGATTAIAVASGTAALHLALAALNIGVGDEVIVPPMTFVATANAVRYVGATPVFVDVDPDSLLLDPGQIEAAITSRTRAILTVDYAGHPSPYAELRAIADRHGLALVGDSCHALGALYRGQRVGSQADLHCFSLHPVKHVTAGEGGVVTARSLEWADRIRRLRNHAMTTDFRTRENAGGDWGYDVIELGWNYRITDLQCALAASQLKRADTWLARRWAIAQQYDAALKGMPWLQPLKVAPAVAHARHLYVVRSRERDALIMELRRRGILANVHYRPVHQFTAYRSLAMGASLPVAESAAQEVLSLPIFGSMTDAALAKTLAALEELAGVSSPLQ